MTVEEMRTAHAELAAKANALGAEIRANTEVARNLNARNRELMDARRKVQEEAAPIADAIREAEEAENRARLAEANRKAEKEAAEAKAAREKAET